MTSDHHCCLEALAVVSRLSQEQLMRHVCSKVYLSVLHMTHERLELPPASGLAADLAVMAAALL